jgi:DNA-binding CsgD family transcriptional regulator
MEAALAIFDRLLDEGSAAIIYNNLGVAAREQGDIARAAEFFQQSAAMHLRLGLNGSITLSHLGDLSLRQGDTSSAGGYLIDALRSATRGGESRAVVLALCRFARLAVAVDQCEFAAKLIGAAESVPDNAGSTIPAELRRELDAAKDQARSTLRNERFRAATADGANSDIAAVAAETLAWAESFVQGRSDGGAVVSPGDRLSPREVEVLRLIASGRSNREIARSLVISLNTVARHISNIFDKLGAANRTEAAAYAHRYGLDG